MFIRKNTQIDVTIFDVSLMNVIERKEIFDQVQQMYKDSLESISNNKDTKTNFVMPAVLGMSSPHSYSSSPAYRGLLYDILGRNKTVNRDTFGKTNIVNYQKSFIKIGKKKKQQIVYMPTIDDENLHIPESKTAKLLETHHKRFIKASGKTIIKDASPSMNKVYMNFIDPFSTETEPVKFDAKNTIFKDVNRILFIDTVYSISEMRIAFYQADALRKSSYGAVTELYLTTVFQEYHTVLPNMRALYKKYGISDTATWRRDIEEGYSPLIEDYSSYLAYNSLLNEDEKQITTNHNVLIPVTFVLFLKDGNSLFQSTEDIIQEEHIIQNPCFFVDTTTSPQALGYPAYALQSASNAYLTKPQSTTFTNKHTIKFQSETVKIKVKVY